MRGLFRCYFPGIADTQINGFANFIGGMTLDDDEAVYGYDSDFGFKPASVFGLQVRGEISDKLSATAQLVGRGSEDYDADFEWAYMTYSVTPNTSISAGRLRVPLFKYSSSLDVGYAYHWITPPQSVYNIDYNNIDGVRVDYQNYVGNWEYSGQLTAGRIETDTLIAGTPANLTLTNVVSVSMDVTRDWFSARALYGVGSVSAQNDDYEGFIAGLRQFGQVVSTAPGVADNLNIDDDSGTFFELAVDIDKYDWFLGAEYTRVDVDESVIAVNDAWYVTAGMRIGKFTPHITYEREEADNSDQFGYLAGLPGTISTGDTALDAGWAQLYQTAQGIVATQAAETAAVTAGVRYDVQPGLALKAGMTWYEDKRNALNDATLLRVGVNYTF
ncbi:topoisomerase IV [Alteromonas halophila]|nr:topoisomerase IV [Alteromonas halophila]